MMLVSMMMAAALLGAGPQTAQPQPAKPPVVAGPPPVETGRVDPALCRPGAPVEVMWRDRWWNATVHAPPTAAGLCPISYDGYDRSWDEAVSADRIRPRTRPM